MLKNERRKKKLISKNKKQKNSMRAIFLTSFHFIKISCATDLYMKQTEVVCEINVDQYE